MMGPDSTTEARLRQMLRDAAVQIHPTRPAPEPGAVVARASRSTAFGLTIGLAVCLVVAAAITFEVHPWGAAPGVGSGGGAGGTGQLLTVETDGAVELLSPDTGAVVRTLVGASPVDSSGRHLSRPYAVTAAHQVAYVAYERPGPVIESIPFTGGTPHYVTDGMYPSANAAGTDIAFVRPLNGTAPGAVVVRDLATGSERTVDSTLSGTIVTDLSWSEDGSQLAMSGLFLPGTTSLILVFGVQVLSLDQPLSGTNPRFVGTPADVTDPAAGTPIWTHAEFVGPDGKLAVLQSTSSATCQGAPTSVVSVDPATGHTRTLAAFPFSISGAVFDHAGDLIVYERSVARSCSPAPTTTTSTTPGRTSIGGSFIAVAAPPVLYKWSAGTSSRLANNVAAAVFVAPGASADRSRSTAGLRAAARAYAEAILERHLGPDQRPPERFLRATRLGGGTARHPHRHPLRHGGEPGTDHGHGRHDQGCHRLERRGRRAVRPTPGQDRERQLDDLLRPTRSVEGDRLREAPHRR